MRDNKVAVVTGAGSGIGRMIALALLDAGWQVALAGRRREPLSAIADEYPQAFAVPTDITNEESVEALFATVRKRFGRIDLLVNNAGTFGAPGAVDEITLSDWRAIVDTNLTGAFLCAHHAAAAMKAQTPQGGRIINNGSVSAHSPRPRSVAYTATKHAITGLTKSISLDGRAYGIACSQIDVGNASTEMTAEIERGAQQADGSVAAEPMFDARHVAEAVLFMAGLPLGANVQFLTITATTMAFIGRG